MKKFGSYLSDKNVYEFYQEPLFLTSEYFNIHFQKSLEDLGEGLDLKSILSTSAQEIASSQFIKYFQDNEKHSVEEKKQVVTDYFADCGFGILDLKSIQAKGGHIDVYNEHYGTAWVKHFGKRNEDLPGVGYFTMGFLCGIIEAIFGTKPGTFDGKQLSCISQGKDHSRFEIFRGFRRKINRSPGLGKSQSKQASHEDSGVLVIESLMEMINAHNENESGQLEWFDTTFTKHYANYYALVEIKLLMQANKKLGPQGFKSVKKALLDVSQKNAYFTFGKIFNSEYWQKELKQNKDLNTSGGMKNCMSLMTTMGYGFWDFMPTEISNQYRIVIHNCPRTNAFLKLVGNTKAPLGFINGSSLVGLANLIEKGTSAEGGIDNEFVDELFKSNHFEYVEKDSRMIGGESDTLVVSQT